MSFNNQWKLLVLLRDSLSKISNDISVQNVLNKDFVQYIQKLPSAITESDIFKSEQKSLIKIPNVLQDIKTKINPVKEEAIKDDTPLWKKKGCTISKSSILSRTNYVLSSIQCAETEKSLQNRIETLTSHIKQYPEARNNAVRQGAIRMLLQIRNDIKSEYIQNIVREALAVLGYVDAVPGPGIRILSIDGGGIRGLLVLEMLKKLEELTGKRVHQMFDLLCGVSTGAILTFSMGIHHKDLNDIAEAYVEISKDVFKQSTIWGTGSLVWSHSYYDTELWTKKLQEHLGNAPLISTSRDPTCPKMCAISTIVNQSRLSAYVFRNYSLPWRVRSQYTGGSNYTVWEAARASAAAPTYFTELKLGDFLHQDGGVLVNNPTAIAIHEAKLIWPETPLQCVVSFGTGRIVPISADPHRTPTSSWTTKFWTILDSATDTEAVHTMLNDLLPDNVYYRFNPYLTEMVSMVEIDDNKLEQLKRDAVMYLRRNEDKFQQVAKVLTEKKSLVQHTKDWVSNKREVYGLV